MPSAREQYLQALASLSDLTRTQAERVASLLAKHRRRSGKRKHQPDLQFAAGGLLRQRAPAHEGRR